MNNEILTKAKNVIAERRRDAEKIAENSYAKFSQHPEFKKLYSEYVDCMITSAKTGQTSPELEAKKSAYQAWLNKHNCRDVSPVYSCKKCEDNGYINGQMCDCLKIGRASGRERVSSRV